MSKAYRFDSFKYVDILQKEISYFLVLAETQNISKASEKLGIRQSGLSRALQRLESDLGNRLFQRRNNGLSLTRAGEQFLSAVKTTQRSWNTAIQAVIDGADVPAGLIKIGFHPSFGQKYFPKIVEILGDRFPELEIEAHTLSSAQVTRKVNEQELDVGLVISNVKNPELISKKIGTDYIAGFQRDLSVTPKKILVNPEMQFFSPVLRKHGQTRKVAIKDYEIIALTCQRTNSLAVLPNSVAEKYPSLKQVGGAYLKANVSCISHREKMRSKAHQKVFETIVQVCMPSSTSR